MVKAVDYFNDQLSGIISGTVTASLIETTRILYNGEMTPLKYIANTSSKDGRIFVIPFDISNVKTIEIALKQANYNAYCGSKTSVCINTGPIGVDERERVIKRIGVLAEEAKVAIRNVRKKLRQSKTIDDEELQKTTDKYVREIDSLALERIRFIKCH